MHTLTICTHMSHAYNSNNKNITENLLQQINDYEKYKPKSKMDLKFDLVD